MLKAEEINDVWDRGSREGRLWARAGGGLVAILLMGVGAWFMRRR